MPMNKFLIDHIDPLGQGVFKQNEQVYFIPKTLPGESGEFKVDKSSKGVNFATCTKLDTKSPQRIESDCKFFDKCNGCHFLHTSYENELQFKIISYQKILSYLTTDLPKINIISNHQRFSYRNRIQLHYNLKKNKLGFKYKGSQEILPINQCLIASKNIQAEITKLNHQFFWKTLLPKKARPVGHLELYDDGELVHLTWNQKYASLGFSQVNSVVNQLLLDQIEDEFSDNNLSILDLFGGSGNLVNHLVANKKLSVDLYPNEKPATGQFHLNLYDEDALKVFKQNNSDKFDTVFIDPPRSGFKQINDWAIEINPKQILYVSCHPATMVRDIKLLLENYEIKSIYLIEFFPGTYHFEGAIHLNKKLN